MKRDRCNHCSKNLINASGAIISHRTRLGIVVVTVENDEVRYTYDSPIEFNLCQDCAQKAKEEFHKWILSST